MEGPRVESRRRLTEKALLEGLFFVLTVLTGSGSAASHARSFDWRTDPFSRSVRIGLCPLYARPQALCRLHRQQPTSNQTSRSPGIPARPQTALATRFEYGAAALLGTVARYYSASRGSLGSVVSGGCGAGSAPRGWSGSAGEAVIPY
jgi:hypothetical protein